VRLPLPREFARFRVADAHVVSHTASSDWIRSVLERHTLYDWASNHPERHMLTGRVPAYSVPIPDGEQRVVIRHAHHGGLLGSLRGDLFFPPTRAPYELLASYILASTGVRTPQVLAFAVYRAGWLLRRADFVTLAVPGVDLGTALLKNPSETERRAWLAPLGDLVRALTRAGAWHPDLNVRNILLVAAPDGAAAGTTAFVLDIDRVRFSPAGDPTVRDANIQRLERSVRKFRTLHGSGFDEEELHQLRQLATTPAAARGTT
jgi:3-deoxy-D-manno-octulosonic acid kinase